MLHDTRLSPIHSVSSPAKNSDLIPEVSARLNTLIMKFQEEKSQSTSIQQSLDQIMLRLPPAESTRESLHSFSQEFRNQNTIEESWLNTKPMLHDNHTQVSFLHLESSCSRNRLGIRESLLQRNEIPIFSGVYPYGWIASVESYFRLEQFTETEKLDLVSARLTSVALDWYDGEINRLPFQNWFQFKDRLLLRFGNLRVTGPSQSLFCIKQKGTIAEYVQRFEELSAQVTGLDEGKLQGIFLCGLRQEMQEMVHVMQPQNLSEMIAFARSMESHDAIVAITKERHQEETSKLLGKEELCPGIDSIQKPALLCHDDSKDVQDHRVALTTKSPVVEEINKNYVGKNVTFSLNETAILQPSCAQELFAHRLRRQSIRRKQRKCFKSWRFKFKNRTKSRKLINRQLIASENSKSICFSFHATVGLVQRRRRFQSLNMQKQAHMSRELQLTQFHMILDKGTLVLLVQRGFQKPITSLYDSFEVLRLVRPAVYHLHPLQAVNIQPIFLISQLHQLLGFVWGKTCMSWWIVVCVLTQLMRHRVAVIVAKLQLAPQGRDLMLLKVKTQWKRVQNIIQMTATTPGLEMAYTMGTKLESDIILFEITEALLPLQLYMEQQVVTTRKVSSIWHAGDARTGKIKT